jgi:hypothetical protein
MNNRGYFPGFATAIRILLGVIVFKIIMGLLSSTPIPENLVWTISLGIVVGGGLLSYKFIPII